MSRRVLGVLGVSLAIVVGSLFAGPALEGEHAPFVLWQLRVPRLLVGMLVGAMLSLAGASFQIVFNNPLATPSTVGTLAGATLGALAALAFGIEPEVAGLPITTLAAFAGALSASLLVAAVASSGRARMGDVLLAGIAVSLAASAIATGVQYVADSRALFAASRWSLGQLPQVGYRGVGVLSPAVVLTSAVLLGQTRALGSLVLGEDAAHAQGVHVPRLRALVLGAASLGVATCVAWCGPIAFVGLIVPHLVRLAVGPGVRLLLPMSMVVGAAFLAFCDALARSIVPGRELPVGVLTAALGAPALILLMARQRA
ncbi:MAG TPA: iron ABC transporter permease [Polyangiaceae bacterium]|nr:iron ABC transporter permease [Polyangiaceae bacterium]